MLDLPQVRDSFTPELSAIPVIHPSLGLDTDARTTNARITTCVNDVNLTQSLDIPLIIIS
jgi:hypothetical protein